MLAPGKSLWPLVLWCALLCPALAWAGRPLYTDDAALTTAGSCQIENWTQQAKVLEEYWSLPACNPGGNFEITLGGTRQHPQDQRWQSQLLVQGKTLFKELSPGSYGVGLAAGALADLSDNGAGRQLSTLYAYVPLSLSLADDRLNVHLNAGWLRDQVLDTDRTTWGLGAVLTATEQWSLFAEFYGDDVADPSVQAGITRTLFDGLLHLDLSAGRQLGALPGTTFFSLGLNVYLPTTLW